MLNVNRNLARIMLQGCRQGPLAFVFAGTPKLPSGIRKPARTKLHTNRLWYQKSDELSLLEKIRRFPSLSPFHSLDESHHEWWLSFPNFSSALACR